MSSVPSRILRPSLPLLFPLVLAACGGRQTETRTAADVAPEVAPPPPPVDTSPVPPPAGLLGKVRIGRLKPLLERADALLGFEGAVANAAPGALGEMLGSESLASLVDLRASVDIAFVHVGREGSDGELAVSFASPAPAEACRRLERGNEVRCVAGENGAFAIERATLGESSPSGMRCALFPTSEESVGRLVCSSASEALGVVGPFLSRTLARVPAEDYVIDAEAAVDELRARYGAELHRSLEESRAQLVRDVEGWQEAPFARPEVKEAFLRIANEILDNVSTILDEGDRYGFRIRIDEDRAHLAYGAHVANPSGSLVRAYRDAQRPTSSVAAELYAHLPPNGVAYGGAAADARPFQAFVDSLVELGHRLLAASGALPPADVEALRTALSGALRLRETTGVGAFAYDANGVPVMVSVTRLADEATAQEVVRAVKTLVTTLRRPAVKRALDALLAQANEEHPLHVADFRDLPTRGLPRGSFGLRTPALDVLLHGLGLDRSTASSVASASAAPAHGRPTPPPVAEILYVPQGRDVFAIAATNARQAFQAVQQTTTAPVDPATLASDEASWAAVIFPGNLRIPAGEEGAGTVTLGSRLGADAANARVDLRLLGIDRTEGARFEIELVLDRAALQVIKTGLMMGMAAFAALGTAPTEGTTVEGEPAESGGSSD